MSAKSKGADHEREARQAYEAEGWQVFQPIRCSRYAEKDIFGMWDFMAVKNDQLHFVQVKTTTPDGFLKKLKQWRQDHPIPGVQWCLWVRLDQRKHSEKWKVY